MDNCIICKQPLTREDSVDIGARGLNTLLESSTARQDGLHSQFEEGITVHINCRKNYTRPSSIRKVTKRPHSPVDELPQTTLLRLSDSNFDFKIQCFFCGGIANRDVEIKKKVQVRDTIHEVSSFQTRDSILSKAVSRNDAWGNEVKIKLNCLRNPVDTEAKYHKSCHLKFVSGKQLHSSQSTIARGRPRLSDANEQFRQLCTYLEDSDECQFSIDELLTQLNKIGETTFSKRTLKSYLKNYFADQIVITELPGKLGVVVLKEKCDQILHEAWHTGRRCIKSDERIRIVEAAARILREDIRATVYDLETYPEADQSSLMNSDLLPTTLQTLLNTVISSKSDNASSVQTKCASIGQAIVSACRTRSFVPPLLLGLGVWAHRRYASRQLVDVLHKFGFSVSYSEVHRYEMSTIEGTSPQNSPGNFVQHVFDNADFNIRTIDGHGTFHSMGGIKCTSPPATNQAEPLVRLATIPNVETIASKAKVVIKWYHKPNFPGLDELDIKDLGKMSKDSIRQESLLDSFWICGMWTANTPTPSWNGFMKCSFDHHKTVDRSEITALPFINLDPNNLSTLHTALLFAVEQCNKSKQQTCIVTFDQPLYIKAVQIVECARDGDDLKRVVVRLGGFHLLMSFMGTIGVIMGGSGIEDIWAQVYAKRSIPSMLDGHSYARALRAHFLTQLALYLIILPTVPEISPNDLAEITRLNKELMSGNATIEDVVNSNSLVVFESALDKKCKSLSETSRTSALWIQYMKQVSLIRIFIRAERTANWDLHLICITQMLPFFHAAGHLNYAKCGHLYVQQMRELKSTMLESEYNKLTTQGYFTIRRSDKFWSGIWTDMVIEQQLMRAIKTSGGLTRGRGINDSTLAQWILSLPGTLQMCNAVETISGVLTSSSDQHMEMRESRQKRDHIDVHKILNWFEDHNPFDCNVNCLISIASGVVADESVNCDKAEEVGHSAMTKMLGQTFGKLKLKRCDKVKALDRSGQCMKVRNEIVPVDTTQLFMRVSLVMKTEGDLKKYLRYELSPTPPALFRETSMRKTEKSSIIDLLPQSSVSEEELKSLVSEDTIVVVDGGMLLRKVVWPRPSTYGQIFNSYVQYVKRHFNRSTIVVFDGYSSISTKGQEQIRRAGGRNCTNIIVDCNKTVTTTQGDFLSNSNNKTQLIEQLTPLLQKQGVIVKQADADADTLIVTTAIENASESHNVTVVANDSDILVLLTARSNQKDLITFFSPGPGTQPDKAYSIPLIQNHIGDMKKHILFVHAMSGCDTTSALFNKGKKKMYNLLFNSDELKKTVSIFNNAYEDKAKLVAAGEDFLLHLYKGRDCKTLDELRVYQYSRSISKTSSTPFNLATLPPTSSAAQEHTCRVYLQIQEWLGKRLDPLEWGWTTSNGQILPKPSDLPPAPNELLYIITCNCRGSCESRAKCGCLRAGLQCTTMCGHCRGTCNNYEKQIIEEDDDFDIYL